MNNLALNPSDHIHSRIPEFLLNKLNNFVWLLLMNDLALNPSINPSGEI